MLSLTEIKTAVQQVLDTADKDRGYAFEINMGSVTFGIDLSYITRIKYDKEPDPQIARDPEVTVATMSEVLPVSISERSLKAFVMAMIEEVKERGIEYE